MERDLIKVIATRPVTLRREIPRPWWAFWRTKYSYINQTQTVVLHESVDKREYRQNLDLQKKRDEKYPASKGWVIHYVPVD
ncbi:MAG: hypothetical protein CL678_16010 [Bdellovibrionaceae bacterium]|nr:hypothetical protein [Pseudobdellovibrionaceae bacterium]